jgi:hypothetical protein
MRLWTIHPCYLDAAGLVAAWREGLLAQKVLSGGTKGYTRHPQLERFRSLAGTAAAGESALSIGRYLGELLAEARARGYSFDSSRITVRNTSRARPIEVNAGQARYELALLAWKLERRSPGDLWRLPADGEARLNGAFVLRLGPIETWERPIEEVLARMRGA